MNVFPRGCGARGVRYPDEWNFILFVISPVLIILVLLIACSVSCRHYQERRIMWAASTISPLIELGLRPDGVVVWRVIPEHYTRIDPDGSSHSWEHP
jgi:hypothetical protein